MLHLPRIRRTEPSACGPDMAPLWGVALQVLAWLIVAFLFQYTTAHERRKLPDRSLLSQLGSSPVPELVLNVGSRGQQGSEPAAAGVSWKGKRVPLPEMRTILADEARRHRMTISGSLLPTVIIRAAAEVPAGAVQELIKAAQAAGFEQFALQALEPPRFP